MIPRSPILAALLAPLLLAGCTGKPQAGSQDTAMPTDPEPSERDTPSAASSTLAGDRRATETATFGAGCFWCVEAVFEQLEGVADVRSGYMGGKVANPTYEQVCTGATGHAEVIQVDFDPQRISFEKLLDVFWKAHDPTQLNRQGADVGTQYRSAIFYHGDEQRRAAEESKRKLAESGYSTEPIVTEITKAGPFYEAENYHQDYYRLNKRAPYCRVVIAPKLEKLGLEK